MSPLGRSGRSVSGVGGYGRDAVGAGCCLGLAHFCFLYRGMGGGGGASKELVSAVNNGRDFCVTCFRWSSKTIKKNIGQDGYSNGVRNSFGGVGRIRRQPSRIRVSLKDSIESRSGGRHAGQGPDRGVSG